MESTLIFFLFLKYFYSECFGKKRKSDTSLKTTCIDTRLEYVSQGRDGGVIFIEGAKRIKFLMEMGAYDCVFYINIPSKKDWEISTKFPLVEREDIITFVAEQTQRDQASSCIFTISDTEIAYYRKA